MFVPELGCYPDDGAGAGPGGVGPELAQVGVVGASGLVLGGDDRAGVGVPGEDVEGEVADGDPGADRLERNAELPAQEVRVVGEPGE